MKENQRKLAYNIVWLKQRLNWKKGMPTMWPNLSQMKPEPVPSTFVFSLSFSMDSLDELVGLFTISRSLMKTTDGEVSYNHQEK